MRKTLRMLALGLAVCLGAGLGAGPGLASDDGTPLVIELYTSQGCSSCPPADALFKEYAAREDVIALAFHVDYWDYLGWKDSFASPAFSQRQRAYARAAGKKMVGTPQMIVQGRTHVMGTERAVIEASLAEIRLVAPPAPLTVTREDGRVSIRAAALAEPTPSVVRLIRYKPSERVEIARGENAGRMITYHNIVTEVTELGRWRGQVPLDLEAGIEDAEPRVVIVQAAGHGPVLAAARVP